jgi:hypothetical protein
MNNMKTTTKSTRPYTKIGHRCIKKIAILPENGAFRLYVLWENEAAANQGRFKGYKSVQTYKSITAEAIAATCDYGTKVSSSAFLQFPAL